MKGHLSEAAMIGVLALQGDVAEHLRALRACDAAAMPVRTSTELEAVDGLVLPGGESTTMARLLRVFGLEEALRRRLDGGLPCLATCAGVILLSRHVLDGRPDQLCTGTLDIDVRRNGYGRQIDSFEAPLDVSEIGAGPFVGVFIRAPVIERVGESVQVIARRGDQPVALRQGRHLALTFHPELTGDHRLHRLFLESIVEGSSSR